MNILRGRVNIRATGLQEFWSSEYTDSIYLWQGAKHDRPLPEIENDPIPTHKDILYTNTEIQEGHDFCKLIYYKTLPILAERLNKIHNKQLSLRFWQISFGKWLYRHIAVLYEKFKYLQNFDINNTGIKLLSRDSFFCPKDHYEYILCFTNNYGVQQLVSLYYYIFCDTKFDQLNMSFPMKRIDFCNLSEEDGGKNLDIALLGVFFTQDIYNTLFNNSHGKIANIALPVNINLSPPINQQARSIISETKDLRSFEAYFYHSLYHCLPKEFLENFKEYFETFEDDIESRKFRYIVAEAWISHIPSAIYTALAAEKKRKFISYEHGAGNVFFKNFLTYIEQDVSDTYLSVGWGKTQGRFVKGGFAVREISSYLFNPTKHKILYISLTKSPYAIELNEATAPNSTFIRELRLAYDFTEKLPDHLKAHLAFRPRPKDVFFWDTEKSLELERRKIEVERGDFREAIHNARIVVIDHISTGISELLLMGMPFILLNETRYTNYEEGVMPIFKKLMACGVLHQTAESAIAHITKIYDNVETWWRSNEVQEATKEICNFSLAPASRVTEYLLGLHADNSTINVSHQEYLILQRKIEPHQPNTAKSQYQFGLSFISRDPANPEHKEAAYWILKAASQGFVEAEYKLAWLYEKGLGLSSDLERAIYWYSRAAEHGSIDACTSLGIIYSKGLGVQKDYLAAYIWFKISAAKGEKGAASVENVLKELLSPDQIEHCQRIADNWIEKFSLGNLAN